MRKQQPNPSSGILIKSAMDYGRLGWSVVPIEARGKESLIRWQVYQHRRPEMTELGDWFNRWPAANLAVVTGVISALVVLDLNPQRGAEASLERLEQEHGPLPETVEAATGGGGRHLYFNHPDGISGERLDLAPGIDLRGDGAYVVAPPSVHASGESYRWVRSPEVFHLEPLPVWLLNVRANEGGGPTEPPAPCREISQTEIPEGKRSDAITALTGHLLSKGVDSKLALDLMLCWNLVHCRPPLAADRVTDAVERAEIARMNLKTDR